MTIDAKPIAVPAWVFSTVIPLVLGVITYVIGLNTINAKTEVKLEHLHEEVIRLEAGKASDEKVDGVINRLDDMKGSMKRIEDYILTL